MKPTPSIPARRGFVPQIPHPAFHLCLLPLFVAGWLPICPAQTGIRLATFDVDVTPPVGVMMAYDPVKRVDELTLRARGIVLLGSGDPIVLCAVDWIGIANEAHDAFRATLARAAPTTPQRVSVHTLHQHDAPSADFTAEPITHLGHGEAAVEEVASNRRILGPDGRVRVTRYTATRDPAVRAEPEGVIDPAVSVLSFWNEEIPVAVLSYYACHPQSYYRTGIPSPDFPGIARFIRGQAVPAALHVHFNGAGGNIGAGKYNDGSHANWVVLAGRLAEGMRQAYERAEKRPLRAGDVNWVAISVDLPVAPHLDEAALRTLVARKDAAAIGAAGDLAWVLRQKTGHHIEISCLKLGPVRVLHLPGELFVEYQLAAKAMRPDLRVVMAAYGDYAPGYIGTDKAYGEGGYETSPRASNVAPPVEGLLLAGIRTLLRDR